MTKDLDEFAMAKLAREMAMQIRNHNAIFADFNLTEEDYYEITKNEFFKRAKEQFSIEWNSTLSVNDRVKLISASYVEETLPTVGRRMLRETEPLAAVIEAGKYLARNAGLGDPKTTGSSSEKFVITINIGDESKTYEKSMLPTTNEIDAVPVYEPSLAVQQRQSPPTPEEIATDRALSTAMKAKLTGFVVGRKD